jgi:hypothetical protein
VLYSIDDSYLRTSDPAPFLHAIPAFTGDRDIVKMIQINLSCVHLTFFLLALICLITYSGSSLASPLGTGISHAERIESRAGPIPGFVSSGRGGRTNSNRCRRKDCKDEESNRKETPDPPAEHNSDETFDFSDAPEKRKKVEREKMRETNNPERSPCSEEKECSGECCTRSQTCIPMYSRPDTLKWRTCCSSGQIAGTDGGCQTLK